MDSARFWSKIIKHESGCWLWAGGIYKAGTQAGTGYYHTDAYDPKKAVHRLAYCLTHGITYNSLKGTPLKQTCGHKLCCNPAHLETTTHKEIKANGKQKNTYRATAFDAARDRRSSRSGAPYALGSGQRSCTAVCA